MEIRIVCDCGQKYIFSVDPDNGQMPTAVTCPVCGADGTEVANEIMAQMFPKRVAEPALAVTPPPPAAERSPARVSPPVRLTMVATPTPLPPAPAPAMVQPPQPVRPVAAAAPETEDAKEFSLGRGVLGAVLGAGLGAGVMYGFFTLAGFRFPLMGTGIGALSGLGARVLARGKDTSLGVIAGVVALLSTAGTLYLMFGDLAGMFIISMVVSVSFAYKIAG
jgi:hypothetical protein